MRQLVHLFSGDNILVLFRMWGREIPLINELGKTKFNSLNTIRMSTISLISFNNGRPEKLDSGRMVWTLVLWTVGHLDSGRLEVWSLDP